MGLGLRLIAVFFVGFVGFAADAAAGWVIVLGQGFEGPLLTTGCDSDPTWYERPDPTIAVGPHHITVTVNSHIYIWHKDPLSITPVIHPLNELLYLDCPGSGDYYDPRCVYDHYPTEEPYQNYHGQRFIVTAIWPAAKTVYLAVSGSDPTVVPWTRYEYVHEGNIDFPGLAYDAVNYYITTRNPVGTESFIHAFWKANPAVAYHKSVTKGPVMPAIVWDGGPTYEPDPRIETPYGYFVEARVGFGNHIRLHSWNNSLNDYDSTFPLSQSGWLPPDGFIEQCNGTIEDKNDDEMETNCVWWGGDFLYGAHMVNSAAQQKEAVRWYDVQLNQWPDPQRTDDPVMIASGTFPAGIGAHTFMPGIAVNRYGEMAMVLGTARVLVPPGIGLSGRFVGAPPSEWLPVVNVKTGLCPPDGRTWGDYFGVAADSSGCSVPEDFWAIAQYWKIEGGQGVWATWIQQFHLEWQ
ncbi:MAG: hypothetical protein AB1486_10960 [Planctomycetota bacterium]